MTMMVEEIGVDLKISKSQCRELNSGPLPYQRRYKDINQNILMEKVGWLIDYVGLVIIPVINN